MRMHFLAAVEKSHRFGRAFAVADAGPLGSSLRLKLFLTRFFSQAVLEKPVDVSNLSPQSLSDALHRIGANVVGRVDLSVCGLD